MLRNIKVWAALKVNAIADKCDYGGTKCAYTLSAGSAFHIVLGLSFPTRKCSDGVKLGTALNLPTKTAGQLMGLAC
tara:strand:- start:217 stop:444 length:228 start_codon:yes stop_codon:yes gene_type:complete